VTIDTLPDDALLIIFSQYRYHHYNVLLAKGKRLVDVCRRWRHVIFGSHRYLGLQLVFNSKTTTRATLDIWPPCPIIVKSWCPGVEYKEGEENIIAGLERSDRVIDVQLKRLTRPAFQKFAAVMTVPFPALKELRLWALSFDDNGPFLPATFLGESAPCLELFSLEGIAFRAIRNLLLSAHHLRDLFLTDIPVNCYIPPQAIVACLSASPHLDYAAIGF